MQTSPHILAVSVLAVIALVGCSTVPKQPAIHSVAIAPEVLMPGETAIITAHVQDRFGIVHRIEGVVQEDPSITFKLKDDGVDPDKKEGDGIWTLQVDVPFNAPPGSFELDLTAYNSDGAPILIRDENGEVAPMATSFALEIRYPER